MMPKGVGDWLATAGGTMGLIALVRYLVDVFIAKRKRVADVQAVHIDTDTKRVMMADTIIDHYKETVDFLRNEVASLRADVARERMAQDNLRERVEILEKILLAHNIPVPPYTINLD